MSICASAHIQRRQILYNRWHCLIVLETMRYLLLKKQQMSYQTRVVITLRSSGLYVREFHFNYRIIVEQTVNDAFVVIGWSASSHIFTE